MRRSPSRRSAARRWWPPGSRWRCSPSGRRWPPDTIEDMPVLVVLGAANLGGAILEHHLAAGWTGAAVSRSAADLSARGSDPGALRAVRAAARERFGGLDLIVNAVSAARPSRPGPFGGGNLADAEV